MKGLKIFNPGGVQILAATPINTFGGIVLFQSMAPLLLKKFEFTIAVATVAGVNVPVQLITATLQGKNVAFQNPVTISNAQNINQLVFCSTLQHISESWPEGILITPSEDTNLIFSFSVCNTAPFTAGDNCSWLPRFYFETIDEKPINHLMT